MFSTDCNQGMLNRLFAYGVRTLGFMKYKLLLMAITRIVVFSVIAAVLYKLGMVYLDVGAMISAAIGIAYITVIGAALTMCFGDGITSNVLSVILGMFLCGGIVPLPMLPDAIAEIGRFTPFGTAKALVEPLFGTHPDVAAMVAAVVYTVLAAWLISNKISKTIAGRA